MKLSFPILCLAIATHCWAEDNLSSEKAFPSTVEPHLEMVITSENPEVSRHVNLGLQCCILNYQEKARYHFKQALAGDGACMLAHVGMLMVCRSGSPEYKEHLQAVNELIDHVLLTPAEEWYMSTFLQYIAGNLQGAAKDFCERAQVYRRDSMAACWDVLLNHYAAEQGGDIVSRAHAYIDRQPGNAIAHYCRALLDEYHTSPSAEALSSAQKLVELLPQHPVAHLLRGHLLSLSGRFDDAVAEFQSAEKLFMDDLSFVPIDDAACLRTASLAEITTYWQMGRKVDALKRSMALTQQLPDMENLEGEGSILMHWEARTLPLRLLVLQPAAPAGAAINAAAKACNAPDNDPLFCVQNCLVEALRARSLAEAGRSAIAARSLANAQQHLADLKAKYADSSLSGGLKRTCFNRAISACMGAIHRARLALYPDSQHIWQPYLDEILAQPATRFLPPVLPQIHIQ